MDIVLVGAANPETGRMIAAVRRAQPDFNVIGFVDNNPALHGTSFVGLPVLGGFAALEEIRRPGVLFVNLITGSTRVRYETSLYLAERGCSFANFVHPSVDVSETEIGVGNYIQEGVLIQAEARVGNNSSIHMGALVAHEVSIGHSVFVAHAVSISGCVQIEDGVFIGTNATILPRLRIGKWATIGAGAVVVEDVPPHATVVGNPARVLRVAEPVYESGDIITT